MTHLNRGDAGKLVSLYDMLRIYADQFVFLGRRLEEASTVFSFVEADREGGEKAELDDVERQDLLTALTRLKEICDQLELPVSAGVMATALRHPPNTAGELERIVQPAYIELKNQLFLFVPAHRARYYEYALDATTADAFPTCAKEITHSGNCYAASEYTASVFHCMRAAEIALWAFSHHLNVQTNRPIEHSEWQTLINEVTKKIDGMRNQPATPQRDEEMQFCSDANSQFFNLKEAFRKHVAHARETYEEGASIDILHRTCGFLRALSKKVRE